MEVDPETLLFTQDSIAVRFRPPHQHQRIDDAVDSILQGEKQASDFPWLQVVKHEGRLWSLDNRRLWVFKHARVPTISVVLVPYDHHTRFTDLMENKQELKYRILQNGYMPEVRGLCRTAFTMPAARRSPPRPFYVNKSPDFDTGPRIRRVKIPEWHLPRNPSNQRLEMELDEDVVEPAENGSGSHMKFLVGLTTIVVALICAQFGRTNDSKLLIVVKGMSSQKVPVPTTRSWGADFGGGIVSILLRVVNETFGRLIPALISWVFRALWGLAWRLLWGTF